MPARRISSRSASNPVTACWWQWVCTVAARVSAGGCQSSGACRSSSSEKVRNRSARRLTSSSSGISSGASARKTAEQDGSRPTMCVPAASQGRSVRSVLRNTRCAMSSWPVEIQVRPQHTGRVGTVTRNPASSSTRTAERATDGWKYVLNVSGHSTTVRGSAGSGSVHPCCAVRRRHHRRNDSSANSGAWRSGATPASRLPSRASPGARSRVLTAAGATREARAHTGSQPSE
jgi:hypothetical protein